LVSTSPVDFVDPVNINQPTAILVTEMYDIWPTLTIGADEVSGDIIVVGQYQCWTGTRLETWYIDWYWSWYQRTDQTGMIWTNTKFIWGLYLSQYEVYTYHIPAKN
jgi:hypothetical protein